VIGKRQSNRLLAGKEKGKMKFGKRTMRKSNSLFVMLTKEASQ